MAIISFFALAFGASIGLTMAVLHFRGVKSGMALGIAHGMFTLGGVALLAIGLGKVGAGIGWWIVLGFLVVATGGAYLFVRQAKDKPWPGFVIVAHGGGALVMIAILGTWLVGLNDPEATGDYVPVGEEVPATRDTSPGGSAPEGDPEPAASDKPPSGGE